MNINIDLNDLKERAKDLAQSGMAKALEHRHRRVQGQAAG